MSDNLARVLQPSGQGLLAHALPAARRHIEAVAPRAESRSRPRIVYALTAGVGMAVIVVTQLLLSVGISQGAYEISTLQSSQVELGRTAEGLAEDLVKVSSPQNLAANAAALGMVSNSTPAYLRLSDGAVLGAPVTASGTPARAGNGATGLVPNALLSGIPLVTDLVPAGAQGTAVGSASHGPSDQAPAAQAPAAPAAPASGLPSPSTR